jgi:hypothetical protein
MLLIWLFYHAASCTESRMRRVLSLCDIEQTADNEGPSAGVSGGAHVSGSSAHSTTRANGFTAVVQRISVCAGVVIKGQTERSSVEGLGWLCPDGTEGDRLEFFCNLYNAQRGVTC